MDLENSTCSGNSFIQQVMRKTDLIGIKFHPFGVSSQWLYLLNLIQLVIIKNLHVEVIQQVQVYLVFIISDRNDK